MDTSIVLAARSITKIFRRGSEEVRALDGVSLVIPKGEFTAFVGPSGSGKTTLLNILGCLDNPSSGELELGGEMIFGGAEPLSESRLTRMRRERFGYVFQKFFLVPTLTVRENIMLPLAFYRKEGAGGDADALASMLGLESRLEHLPGELSGGEMQRVAIARALVNDPDILLADEPTGNLDSRRSGEVGDILVDLNRKKGISIILVTHNAELAARAHRAVEIRDGRIAVTR